MQKLITNIFKTFLFFDLSLIIIHKLPVFSGENTALTVLKNSVLPFAVVAILSLVFVLAVEKEKIKISLGGFFKNIYRGTVSGIVLPAVVVGIAFILRKVKFGSFTLPKGLAFWLISLLVSAITTELLIRGYLFKLYKKEYSFEVATILTTLLYLSIDITLFFQSKIFIANIILLNILLCFILEYTGSRIATVFARFFFLVINCLLFGIEYPLKGYPVLWNISFSQGKLFGSGEFGILSSLLVLILLSAVTAYTINKKYDIIGNSKIIIGNTKKLAKELKTLAVSLWTSLTALIARFKRR